MFWLKKLKNRKKTETAQSVSVSFSDRVTVEDRADVQNEFLKPDSVHDRYVTATEQYTDVCSRLTLLKEQCGTYGIADNEWARDMTLLLQELYSAREQFLSAKKDMDNLRNNYIAATVTYTDIYAQLSKLKDQCENGEYISDETAQSMTILLQELSDAREQFLSAQREMGYDTGDMFLQDCAFRGFSLKNGQLTGDCESAYRIAYPWYFEFVNGKSDDNFKFEMACLLVNLTNTSEYSLAE